MALASKNSASSMDPRREAISASKRMASASVGNFCKNCLHNASALNSFPCSIKSITATSVLGRFCSRSNCICACFAAAEFPIEENNSTCAFQPAINAGFS